MIFVDTNYFLRFFLNDITHQHLKVKELFLKASEDKIKLFSSTIVFFEVYWVFKSYYEKSKEEILLVLSRFLELKFIDLHERAALQNSLDLFAQLNLSLEDCYNLAYAKINSAKSFKTFDIKLEKEFAKKP